MLPRLKPLYGAEAGPNVSIIRKKVMYLKVQVLILNFEKYNDVFIEKIKCIIILFSLAIFLN